jgi:DNA-directed RNA polymerase specialized sigma24 family protein
MNCFGNGKYAQWKEDKHNFVCIRATGQTTEVSPEIMREFWREDHEDRKERKEALLECPDGTTEARFCSFEESRDIDLDTSCIDQYDAYADVEFRIDLADFLPSLTAKQRMLFALRYKGFTLEECTDRLGIGKSCVNKTIKAIQKKYKKFFDMGV